MSNAPAPDEPVSRALLGRAIDYAGLFPPASLPLADVLANYRIYQASPECWALGRLVIPADRLDELAEIALRPAGARHDGPEIPISALIGAATAADVAAIDRFNREHSIARVAAVEVKAASAGAARAVLAAIPPEWTRYVEIPPGEAGDEVLEVLAFRGAHAKLRSGGTSGDDFPGAGPIAHLLVSARSRGVALKATAGLHHPLRGSYPLTYAPDAAAGTMFGYLNLLLGAMLAWQGRDVELVGAALLESDPGSLRAGPGAFRWREESFPVAALATMRAGLFHGFGSCSFLEPLQEWPL